MSRLSAIVLIGVVGIGIAVFSHQALAQRPAPPAAAPAAPAAECAPQAVVPLGEQFFQDISAASGIQDQNYVPNPPTPVPSNDHSRLAFVDLNRDGRDDIVMHNMTGAVKTKPFEHLVFLNNGDGTFRNFSDESGLRNVQSAFFAFGDVDNDGDQDCFAGVDGEGDTGDRGFPNQMLLNDGQGHFTLKENSGIEGGGAQDPPVAANAVFADFDGDTRLDLFIGRGGTGYGAADQLFLGRGDGTFVDATDRLAERIERASNGSVACDYDNDGDLDIFVSVYGVSLEHGHDVLWENDGTAHFTNVARARGFEAQATGNYFISATGFGRDLEPVAPADLVGGNGFGLACEDVNNDGYLDIWQANISHPGGDYNRTWSDPSLLLINQGPAAGYSFKNVYLDAGIPYNEGDLEGAVADFDNDGLPDLSVTRESKYEVRPEFTSDEQRGWFGLMHQLPGGQFESVGMISGINDPADTAPMPRLKGGHSNVWSDIDLDGDLDLLVGGLHKTADGRPNFLFRNDIGSRNAWLAIRVESNSPEFNRDAIGTRVELVFPDRVLMREVRSSRGMYNASDTRVLHFGLGALGCPQSVKVTWPDRTVNTYDGGSFGQNRYWTIRSDGQVLAPTPAPGATASPVVPATATLPAPTATPAPAGILLPYAYRP
jgi:enediyne biosynthesis protein E4